MNETNTFIAKIQEAQAGNMEAKTDIVKSNMGLVISVSRRFYSRGTEPEDLHQMGAIGLLHAIERFDTKLGLAFSTFAVPHILGEIRQFLRDDGLVKVSRSVKHTAYLARQISEKLEHQTGKTPTLCEIADALSVSKEALSEAISATNPVYSFSAETDDGLSLEALMGQSSFEAQTLEKLSIRSAIASLPERDRILLLLRYKNEKTQREIAKVLGVSQVQVSRLEKKALARLKKELTYVENSVVS